MKIKFINDFIALSRVIFQAAGTEKSILQRSLLWGAGAAIGRGLAFWLFIPLFLAISDHNPASARQWLIVVAFVTVATLICDWQSRAYDYSGAAGRAGDALRRQIGQHLRAMPLQMLYRERAGHVSATIASDIDDVINYTTTVILMLMQAVITPFVFAIGACFYNALIGGALLIIFPLLVPVYLSLRPKLQQGKQDLAAATADLSAETIEYTQGLPVLKAAICVGDKFQRFARAVEKVENVQIKSLQQLTMPNLLLSSAIEMGLLFIVFLGLYAQPTDKIAFIAAVMVAIIRFAEPLTLFIGMMNVVEMVPVGYQRLQRLLAIAPLPQRQPEMTPSKFFCDIAGLHFQYDGCDDEPPALDNINLHIPAQALTALVGHSGCGKTTLIRMLMRYADPQQGTVKIGDVDVRQIPPETLNRLIAVVFQDVYLFDDTILANIRLGRAEASEEEIIAAAKQAQCHDFISQLPNGYHTRVGDIGNHLSGGEKQRISIARALLKDAPIVILDEPTAALDTYSELAVQEAINALVKNKTVIVIAHRLSTIVAAKQIVVLKEGQIIETGTHDSLLQAEGHYAKLWRLQHR